MATTYYENIQKLYVAYFNRPADPAGLAYWEGVVEAAKGDTTAVSAAFAADTEYKTTYSGLSNADIVNKVYQNLFGRDAEAAGKAYWAEQLDKKTITIDQVVTAVASGAQGTDLATYNNRVTAAGAFTAAVDTDVEKTGYTGAGANAVAKTFLSGVTDAASLAAAIATANLNTTVAKAVAAGPFALNSALAAYNTANQAVTDYLDAADGKADGTVAVDARDKIAAAIGTAEVKIDTLVSGPAYVGATAGVKAALLADQVAANSKGLADAQKAVSDANTEINKVAGLSTAISTLASAKTASDAADKAVLNAQADAAAKEASYETLNHTTVTVNADGTVAGLIELKDNKLQLVSGVTEDKNAGVTALLNASTAKEAADAAATKAAAAEASAQSNVDYLDMSATEKTDLTTIKGLMKNVTVADGAVPTLAQITTEQSILDAKAAATGATPADVTAANNFKAAVTTYMGHAGTNDLVSDLKDANDAVDAATAKIKALTDAVADLQKAQAAQTQLTGLDAAAKVTADVFTAHDLSLPVPATGAVLASAGSDIFVATKADATISLFGLLGTDSLYIGSQYTLNTGKLETGNNSVLEAFVAQSGSDTTIKLEKSVFGSNASTPEVVTITLTGVDATKVHLTNGIITVA